KACTRAHALASNQPCRCRRSFVRSGDGRPQAETFSLSARGSRERNLVCTVIVETVYLGSYEDPFSGWRLAEERKRKRFLSLREEAESGIWSAPCTLSAAELASTEPSDETVRRWRQAAAAREAAAAAERKYHQFRGY